jgi:hypothetical protein
LLLRTVSYSYRMQNLQDLSVIAKRTTEKAMGVVKLQAQKLVRLVIKPPKKPPLSWEIIIGQDFAPNTNVHAGKKASVSDIPKVNQRLAQLSEDVFDELFVRIQKNVVDEIQAIRLYEKLLDSEIKIVRGHVHFYRCTTKKGEETIDYATLISRLQTIFVEHKEMVARSAC